MTAIPSCSSAARPAGRRASQSRHRDGGRAAVNRNANPEERGDKAASRSGPTIGQTLTVEAW